MKYNTDKIHQKENLVFIKVRFVLSEFNNSINCLHHNKSSFFSSDGIANLGYYTDKKKQLW